MSRSLPLLLLLAGCTIDTKLSPLTDDPGNSFDSGVTADDSGATDDSAADDSGRADDSGINEDARVRTAGRELWLAFMENLDLAFNEPPFFTVVIEAPEGAEGELSVPATGYSQPFSLAVGEIAEIALPDAVWYAEGSDVRGVAGVRVSADRAVEAVAVHYRIYFTEASRLLPTAELGADYRVLAVPDLRGAYPSSFVVVATDDDTEVEITPSTFTYGLRPADTPYTVTLNEGEVWQVQAAGDLSGSRVRSLNGEPIAVFAGAQQAYAGCGEAADSHVWDQVLPLKRWGQHSVVLPTARKRADVVRVLAHEDGTEVRIDCGAPVTLGAGEVYELSVSGGAQVSSSAPVLVGQVLQSGNCEGGGNGVGAVGDPNFTVLVPAAMTRPSARFRSVNAASTLADATHHVGLWAPGGEALQVDGAAVSGAATTVSAGDHDVTGDGPFQGVAYGLAPYEAYTYNLGYDCEGCLARLSEEMGCE